MELDPYSVAHPVRFVIASTSSSRPSPSGLAAWLATIEGARLVTGNPLYRRVFDFWLKVFAVSFGMGVVTGIVMAFQFGTNWSVLAEKTGSIQGPLLGYEAFTAFMLEATFFGVVLLRARSRVAVVLFLGLLHGRARDHVVLVLDPRQQQLDAGAGRPHDRRRQDHPERLAWRSSPGPVFLIRWPHMLLAAFLTTGMCVAATGAWYVLRGVHRAEARVMLHWGLGLVAVLIPIQLFFGHLTGLYVLKHQPAKFAAIEARWKTQQPASEVLIAIPDEAKRAQSLRDRDPEAWQLHRLRQLDCA